MSALFWEFLRGPRKVGSAVPSSRHLASAMAGAAMGADSVIELGAGTGPVTHALVEAGFTGKLVVSEVEDRLARQLTRRFPGEDVRCQPAQEVLKDFEVRKGEQVALVSSLPFRSMGREPKAELESAITSFLKSAPGSWLVQFTYREGAPFNPPDNFEWRRIKTVWRNTPPARVWVLRENLGAEYSALPIVTR